MKKPIKKSERSQVQEQETATLDSFIIDSVNFLADERDIYSVIKSFQRLQFEWNNLDEPTYSQEGKKTLLSDLHAIETLLCDIAEASAKYNQMILDGYEQD